MASSRNAALDGLRAIAVLAVLLYHHGMMNSGWLGVDIFFSLSGFLITTILRQDRDRPEYWRRFWVKRVLRIVPPLVLVLLLTVALAFPLSKAQCVAYLSSFGDVLAYLRPTFEPLRPLWSLAVEEHFYLLWPFAVRYWQRRTLLGVLAAIVALEPLLRGIVSMHTHQWELLYFLTPFRLDGLALGAMLAIVLEDAASARRVRVWCAPCGILCASLWLGLRWLLGVSFTRDNPTVAYNTCCYSLVAAVCTCGVAYVLSYPGSWGSRLLGMRGLAWLGLISYGLYLYQVPVHEAVLRLHPQRAGMALAVDAPIILILAAGSYYFVEKPAMNLGRYLTSVTRRAEADPVTSPAL